MQGLTEALRDALEVLGVALLFGVTLPAVFALGVRALAHGAGGNAEVAVGRPHPAARVVAVVCFAAVLAAVAYGIFLIVSAGLVAHK